MLGTIIRETIGTIGESRKTGFNPTFLSANAAYTDLIPKLGARAMGGMYSTMTVQHPYLDETFQPIRFWANKYKTKFNEDPGVVSIYGYQIIDIFIRIAQKAGANLSTESFINALDSSTIPADIFGSSKFAFGPSKHLGSDASRVSQIQEERWRVISEYTKPQQ